jgi:hypothetical protein
MATDKTTSGYTKNINVFQAIEFANGDGAKEAAYQAERQFMEDDFDKKEINEELGIEDDGFSEMYYKDDDGYWRITGKDKKWDTYEEMCVENNID